MNVNNAHPGRTQWGPGFYLGSRATAEAYAKQTKAPAVVEFKQVKLAELGVVLDLTKGEGKKQWDAYLAQPLSPNMTYMTYGTVFRQQHERRGLIFEEFLAKSGHKPDVVIAPHENAVQIVVRTEKAASILNRHLSSSDVEIAP